MVKPFCSNARVLRIFVPLCIVILFEYRPSRSISSSINKLKADFEKQWTQEWYAVKELDGFRSHRVMKYSTKTK